MLFYILCLAGGSINIPIAREQTANDALSDEMQSFFQMFFGIRPPVVRERTLAVNVGGAILPGLLCLYLLAHTPFLPVLAATIVTTTAAYRLSKPVAGVGQAPSVAYIFQE